MSGKSRLGALNCALRTQQTRELTMPDAVILATQDVTKHFGGLHAVDGVSLAIQAGTFHSIIGPNGAGKTTLFNLLSGAMKPTSGRIVFKGQDITGLPPYRRSHLGIGRSFQITNT